MGLRDALKSLFSPPEGESSAEACLLLSGLRELEEAIESRDKLMVLVYASWCPYSQAFLRIYLDHASKGDPCYARIVVDGGDPVVEKYAITVFPTVLFFEKGALVRRLDGVYHVGLSRAQLEDFARRCAVR
jgi:thioredoxin-like negative regulator of GroEL